MPYFHNGQEATIGKQSIYIFEKQYSLQLLLVICEGSGHYGTNRKD